MQLRVIKNMGTYRVDQRLRMDTFHAKQLIAAGIAVEDASLGADAILSTPGPLSDAEVVRLKEDWQAAQRPKRRHRRRDLDDPE